MSLHSYITYLVMNEKNPFIMHQRSDSIVNRNSFLNRKKTEFQFPPLSPMCFYLVPSNSSMSLCKMLKSTKKVVGDSAVYSQAIVVCLKLKDPSSEEKGGKGTSR